VLDFDRIIGFDWDTGNDRKSAEKHGVSQSEVEQMFFNEPLLVIADVRHSQHELRFHALGQTTDRRLLHVTFTLRREDTLIRVISARNMSRNERNHYAQEV
jgi:uncharacterized DUF497 family protein